MAASAYVMRCGVLTIAVKMVPAARGARLGLRNVHRTCAEAGRGGELGTRTYCRACGAEVGVGDLAKACPNGDGWVLVDPAALSAVPAEASRVMEVRGFVRLAEVDSVWMAASSWLVPADEAAVRPWALLRAAMARRKRGAWVRYVQAGRRKDGLVRPTGLGLLLHELFSREEVRLPQPVAGPEPDPEELRLAERLVAAAAVGFAPEELRDERQRRLQELVAEALGRPWQVAPGPEEPGPDVARALRESIAALQGRGRKSGVRPPAEVA